MEEKYEAAVIAIVFATAVALVVLQPWKAPEKPKTVEPYGTPNIVGSGATIDTSYTVWMFQGAKYKQQIKDYFESKGLSSFRYFDPEGSWNQITGTDILVLGGPNGGALAPLNDMAKNQGLAHFENHPPEAPGTRWAVVDGSGNVYTGYSDGLVETVSTLNHGDVAWAAVRNGARAYRSDKLTVAGPTPPTGSIGGAVVDAEDRPIQGANVSAGGKSVVTTPSGNFVMSDLSAGTVTVDISKQGYKTVSRSVTVQEGQTTDMGKIVLQQTGFSIPWTWIAVITAILIGVLLILIEERYT